jgi:ubiquinone/menaquinone biosynthesis C-methylase UbiE
VSDGGERRETYTHGHSAVVVEHHARRTAGEAAAFLLPHLAPGARVLDVGCGPGSITCGLAEHVAPGEAVGLDVSPEAVEAARRHAATRGVANARFEVGSIYQLPYPDGSFDAVFGHQVFHHLRARTDALREMARVARPGGLIALREVDWGTVAHWPPDPHIERFLDLYHAVSRENGGEPQMGRRLRALFNEAALADVRIGASVWCYATPESTREWGEAYSRRVLESAIGDKAVEYGLADRAELEAISAAFRAWSTHPDAFWSFVQVEALGRRA